MAISPQTGIPTYLGTNGANGTTVVGTRSKVANPLGVSAQTGAAYNAASTVSPVTAPANYVANTTGPVTGKSTPGSLNVNSTVVGKEVQPGVYS